MIVDAAAFCPAWHINNRLGIRGFVDKLVIALDHRHKTLRL